MEGKDYAQRLNKLPITSIQRRHERYKILYAYKVKEGLVPNISKEPNPWTETLGDMDVDALSQTTK